MEKETRTAIDRATQKARRLLEDDFAAQLEGDFDVLATGSIGAKASKHLKPRQVFTRDKVIAAIEHKRGSGLAPAAAVADYLRDAAFTTLNRFAALKMLEARGLVQTCVSKGEESGGYVEYAGMAPGVKLLPDGQGYRLYLECIFDELSTEVKVLFDRRDPASALWPKRPTLLALLELLNDSALASVWGQDETIGWIYQYFNGSDERKKMREESQAPRNSRELAVRNQFFTPRYVVQFLTDNTLGRIWYEMRGGETALKDRCEYLVRKPDETWAPRAKKDPRDLKVLDPACGSGHFLLYAFDVLTTIYAEGWADADAPKSEATGRRLADDYATEAELRKAMPALVLAHNLHGVDIDARCAQIAQLALWMRAQRAYQDGGVARAERPIIRRSNIVIAEPLVADEATVNDFVAALGDAELGKVFTALVESLKLAGDLGLLLRVEKLLDRGPAKGQTGELFAPAQARIRATLAKFVGEAEDAGSTRRRLFADDAAQGMGLLEIAEKKYDTVLMNPPFGAASCDSEKRLNEDYPRDVSDLAASFVTSALSRLSDRGLVGVIATRKPLFIKTFAPWREHTLLSGRAISVCADLGRGVLDATVESAAYVVARTAESRAICFRCFSGGMVRSDAAASLRVSARRENGDLAADVYDLEPGVLASLPGTPFAYWVSPALLSLYGSLASLSASRLDARFGASTKDDFRFLRLWTEVSHSRVARTRAETFTAKPWVAIAKGGEYSPFFRDVELVMNWEGDGKEAKAFISDYRADHGWSAGWAAALNGADCYFRPGVTWSRRTSTWISPRILPAGCIFGDKAPTIFDAEDDDAALMGSLGWMASSTVGALIALSVGKEGSVGTAQSNSYEVGIVSGLPFPSLSELAPVVQWVVESYRIRKLSAASDELSLFFCGPLLAPTQDWVRRAVELQREIDRAVAKAMGVPAGELAGLEPESRLGTLSGDEVFESRVVRRVPNHDAILEFLVGVAFGRYVGVSHGTEDAPSDSPFAPLPLCSPAMQVGLDRECRDALPDDDRHPLDLVSRVLDFGQRTMPAFGDGLGLERIRAFFRKELFSQHLSTYSRSRRKAPIYWQLATPSASYSVWLYLHAFTKDTMFHVEELVNEKVLLEERKANELRNEAGASPSAAARKALAAQETFLEELRGMAEEVRRVKPLWKPDLDDGVVINFAPLWRLVPQHKAWQKELRETWAALCAGDYDWSHLAMHLWPDRVVPRCATDRSFAIAHGLEDTFWLEDANGKWKPRATPTRPLADLIAERTSAAVTAARDSLIAAPTPGGGGASKKKRAAPKLRRPRR